ncbi:hypothetical protein EG328_011247 [Venturia inaequalis]|uniref:Uncharacterized protein n=1 Tax=Venturia inaequalis TaxID=5025 RepID=A0A8H3U5W2_VENIN|nr:hypothetical protein EG328_011247 [Venturia inaequalis]
MQDIVSAFPQVLKDKETIDPKEFSTRTDITIATEDLDFDPEDDLREDLYNVDALPLELGVVDTQIRILLDVVSF